MLGVCVGHEQLVDEICEGGLDAVVNTMHDRFAQLNLEALHYASGTAQLVDDDGDGVADRIVNGTWDAADEPRPGPAPHARDVFRIALTPATR